MKQVLLERPLTLQLSWLLGNKPEFGAATRLTESLSAGKDWKAKPRTYGHDLRFKQEGGRLLFESFYGPCRLADLGLRQLDPTLSLDTGSLDFLNPQGEVLEGHVYLLRQEHFDPPYWVLFRVDAIGKPVAGLPTRPPVNTSAVSAQTDPLFTNVVNAIQQLRGRLREQTLGLDKLYNLLGAPSPGTGRLPGRTA